jgi:hypothetical protein
MLLDRSGPGDAARAGELLHRALDDYVRFSMPGYAAAVERMLAAITSASQ